MAPPLVTIKADLQGFERRVSEAVRKQIPFATARALTKVALVARDELRRQLPERFTIRSGWVAKGVTIVPANKTDWPNPFAVVGSRDDFMLLQETGGPKLPKYANKIAVPTSKVKRTSGGRIPKALKPATLVGRVVGSRGPLKPGKGTAKGFVDGDTIRVRESRRRAPVYYWLKDKTQVPARWDYVKTVEGVVDQFWPSIWKRSIQDAIKTSK